MYLWIQCVAASLLVGLMSRGVVRSSRSFAFNGGKLQAPTPLIRLGFASSRRGSGRVREFTGMLEERGEEEGKPGRLQINPTAEAYFAGLENKDAASGPL